jgi:hypothetical protein
MKLGTWDSPNFIAFTLLTDGIHKECERTKLRVAKFIHDEQNQFAKVLKEAYEVARRGKFSVRPFSWLTQFEEVTPWEAEIEFVSSADNLGVELVDMVLWLMRRRVERALEELRQALPFRLRGIDSDNGSEFINQHLWDYCQAQEIQFTRGRPYKKDDNAHIEQKNWTHVRKLLGYVRYDTPAAQAAIHRLYRDELRLFQNLFLPSVKLLRKERVGARVRRRYDAPRTPLDRVLACPELRPEVAAHLQRQRDRLDPFALARTERPGGGTTGRRGPRGPAPSVIGRARQPERGARHRQPHSTPAPIRLWGARSG